MEKYATYDVIYFDAQGREVGRNYYFCRPVKATQRQPEEGRGCQNLVEDVLTISRQPLPNHPVPATAVVALANFADIYVFVDLSKK